MSSTLKGQEYSSQFLGNFEYSLVSGIGDVDLQTYALVSSFNFLNKKSKWELGIHYRNHQFYYFGQNSEFKGETFENFHTLGANISHTYSMGRNLTVHSSFSPTFSSNFRGNIQNEDFIPTGSIGLCKLWKSDGSVRKLSVSATYGTLLGIPRWYPEVSFELMNAGKWSYTLGFPKTWIAYNFDNRHTLKGKAQLFGLYANNSDTITYANFGTLTDTKLRFNGTDLGLEHNYNMGTGFTTVVRIGYQQAYNLEILDNKNTIIHDFEPDGTPYITMGLKYKLNY